MVLFKRYKRYKDSGVKWIGEVPEGWRLKRLKFGVNLRNKKATDDNDLAYIGLENIESKTGKIIESISTDEEVTIEGTSNVFFQGDILFGKLRPYLAKCTVAQFDGKCTTELLVIKTKNGELHNKYLGYLMLSSAFIDLVNSSTYGSKMPRANWDFIGNQYIPSIDINEQTQIANFLDQKTAEIDSLIADKEKLIALLGEQRQAIITEAVTKGLNPDVKMKDSGVEWIGEIPEGWRISRIKYQADINKNTLAENTDADLEIEYIDIGSVNAKGEVTKVESFTFEKAPSRARRILKNGDTIVSTVRTYLKAITWFEKVEGNLICSTGFAVLSPKKTIHPRYLSYLFRSTKYIDEIVSRSTGVSYPAITAGEIGMLECLLPDIDEQKEIAEFIDKRLNEIDSLLQGIKDQIDKIKEYRQSLIFEAVTGKIDVRDVAVEVTSTA